MFTPLNYLYILINWNTSIPISMCEMRGKERKRVLCVCVVRVQVRAYCTYRTKITSTYVGCSVIIWRCLTELFILTWTSNMTWNKNWLSTSHHNCQLSQLSNLPQRNITFDSHSEEITALFAPTGTNQLSSHHHIGRYFLPTWFFSNPQKWKLLSTEWWVGKTFAEVYRKVVVDATFGCRQHTPSSVVGQWRWVKENTYDYIIQILYKHTHIVS
jgi:hypothetical protein